MKPYSEKGKFKRSELVTRRVDGEDDGRTGPIREAGWGSGIRRRAVVFPEPGALVCTAVRCHLFNDAQAGNFVLQRAHTQERERFVTSLLSVRCAPRGVPAKSHRLSSAEVQRSRGRWYVTESRLRADLCLRAGVFVCVLVLGPAIQAELMQTGTKKKWQRLMTVTHVAPTVPAAWRQKH